MKSKHQIKILGIVRGWTTLPTFVRQLTHDCTCLPDTLGTRDQDYLDTFIKDQCLDYFQIFSSDEQLYMVEDQNADVVTWTNQCDKNDDHYFWTKSWDNMIENKATGDILNIYNIVLALISILGTGEQASNTKNLIIKQVDLVK